MGLLAQAPLIHAPLLALSVILKLSQQKNVAQQQQLVSQNSQSMSYTSRSRPPQKLRIAREID